MNFHQNFEFENNFGLFLRIRTLFNLKFEYSETYFELDSEEATAVSVCTYCGSGFNLFMYVYRAFDTSDITNKLLKCNLMYWFELFFISFNTFDMVLYYICKIGCSMQHGPSTPLTYPGSCKTCFSHIPVFGRTVLLIFLIIYQIAHLHN